MSIRKIRIDGVDVTASLPVLNFISGTGIDLSVAEDSTNGELEFTVTVDLSEMATAPTFTQTYSTTASTVPAATATAVATTGATNSSPYGFTAAAQADNLVTAVNALIADVLAVRKTQNLIIDTLQAAGLAA